MGNWIKQLFIILLIVAFTPLAFSLMPAIVIVAVVGGIYMIIAVSRSQHHHLD